jgi:hypothetical protein
MFKLMISGFKTQAQAEAFVKWYEGQGEQDAAIWFECRFDEGEIDTAFMPVDCASTYPLTWSGDTLSMVVNP